MASKRDLQSYYAKSDNAKAKWSNQNDKLIASYLIKSTPNITGKIEILLVQQEVKKQVVKSHYENIQLKMRQEIGNYSTIHGNKAAIDRCSKICVKFFLKRTTVNTWKEQFKIKDFLLFARKKKNYQILWLMKFGKDQRFFNRITFSRNSNISKNENCDWNRCY